MMAAFLYNLFLSLGVIVFSPFIFVKIILSPKYRGRLGRRLGAGLGPAPGGQGPRVWLHALSVGEAASAFGLAQAIRRDYPQATLIFSSTTLSGETYARTRLAGLIDSFLAFPFDLRLSVGRLISWAKPDLFILIETDFWPNFLFELKRRGIPCLLVNGRISKGSLTGYQRFSWLFTPLFNTFHTLAMQTEQDAAALRKLGVSSPIVTPGNLKYASVNCMAFSRPDLQIPVQALVWVAGSTHPGEEGILLAIFKRLRQSFPELFLILAPRDAERGAELAALAASQGISVSRRSADNGEKPSALLILDTIGELSAVYALGDLAFVGGSLVPERGHNPLEPGQHGKAVLFGPHMEDFAEISHDLIRAGGARLVRNAEELETGLAFLLANPAERKLAGQKALALIKARSDAGTEYLTLIREALAASATRPSSRRREHPSFSSAGDGEKKKEGWYFLPGRPFSAGYGLAMRLRAFLYRKNLVLKSWRLPVPVISVGNLTLGGTGKTPMVRYLASLLRQQGRRPAIVSRGYGGRATGRANVVSDGTKTLLSPQLAGDEPFMLAGILPGVPVLTGAARIHPARQAICDFGADCVIMDDGFQHLALERDLNLVLFSAGTLLGSGRVFPGGILREPISALERAHAFVITGDNADKHEKVEKFRHWLKSKFPEQPVFTGEYLISGIKGSLGGEQGPTLAEARGMRLFAFAGIADPGSFLRTLREAGFSPVGFRGFGDHHHYSDRDIRALINAARANEAAALITTEKDLVKLKAITAELPIMALTVELRMNQDFDRFILARMGRR